MSSVRFSISTRLLGIVLAGLCLMWAGGCDTVPGLRGERDSPEVSDLQIAIDSVQVVEEDSQVQIDLFLSVQATDQDGTIDRVVFTLEPASNPQRTVSGELPAAEGSLYGGLVQLTLPFEEEVYTVRVFAEDDDGLASNQVTSQFHFVPESQVQGPADPFQSSGPSLQSAASSLNSMRIGLPQP